MAGLESALGLAPGSGLAYGLLGLIFGAVFLLVIGTASLLGGRGSLRERVMGGEVRRRADAGARETPTSLRYRDDAHNIGRVLAPVTRRLVPTDIGEVSHVRLR